MLFKVLCKLGIHNWDDWKLWKWDKYSKAGQHQYKTCNRCGKLKYRKINDMDNKSI